MPRSLAGCVRRWPRRRGWPSRWDFPTAEQAHAASPTAPALAPQDYLEPVLLAHSVDDAAAQAFGIGADGAVLVRPDGQTTARWHSTTPDPANTLHDSVATSIAGLSDTTAVAQG